MTTNHMSTVAELSELLEDLDGDTYVMLSVGTGVHLDSLDGVPANFLRRVETGLVDEDGDAVIRLHSDNYRQYALTPTPVPTITVQLPADLVRLLRGGVIRGLDQKERDRLIAALGGAL